MEVLLSKKIILFDSPYYHIRQHILAATALEIVHSGVPIFDDAFEHFERYFADALGNIVFQCLIVAGLSMYSADFTLHQQKKFRGLMLHYLDGQFTGPKRSRMVLQDICTVAPSCRHKMMSIP